MALLTPMMTTSLCSASPSKFWVSSKCLHSNRSISFRLIVKKATFLCLRQAVQGKILGLVVSAVHSQQQQVGSLSCLLERLQDSVYNESPLHALRRGRWVKLICGASFEDVVEVRNLSLIYTLAGVDCIDCAADQAVVIAVLEGINAAKNIAVELGYSIRKPWIMVSINDDEDPHFRKAEFNPELCPSDCPRPCERVCPASAIYLNLQGASLEGGVIAERCYGCGRCIPVCPVQNIEARTYIRSLETVSKLLCGNHVDAVEIHTGAGHLKAFDALVVKLASALKHLKVVAVSIPDLGDSMVPAMASMYESMRPHLACPNLWQLDGRPMSGDIGKGATKAAVALGVRVATSLDRPPGFLQLAGGTNSYTVEASKLAGLFNCDLDQRQGDEDHLYTYIGGIAFGGYARKIVSKFLKKMEVSTEDVGSVQVENYPGLLCETVAEAGQLVWPIKLAHSWPRLG